MGGKADCSSTLRLEEVKIKHREEKDQSADKLVVPKFPDETLNEVQRHSGSKRNQKRDDKER